jgi:hypothetical protein
MGCDVGPQATRGVCQAVLRSGPHRDAWPPPCQEGAQRCRLRIRERARRRAHRLGKVGHGTGLEDIGVG